MKSGINPIGLRGIAILLSLLIAPVHGDTPDAKENATAENSLNEQADSNKQASQVTPLAHRVREAIDNSLQPFSGSVLLSQGGKPLLSLQKGRGIDQESSFVIASLSKQITATLILRAVDAGKLHLDRTINSYRFDSDTRVDNEPNLSKKPESEASPGFDAKFETVADADLATAQADDENAPSSTAALQSPSPESVPEILYGTSTQEQPFFNPNRFDERITLHHLLSHTSGIDRLGKPNRFEPGSQFQYSNYGYTVLGELLEQVNQQPLAQQIADFKLANRLGGIYAELGDIDDIRQRAPALAIGLTETANGLSPSDLEITPSLIPAGGVIATARAFADFQQKLHSGKLTSAKSYHLMTTPHTEIAFLWPNMSYGYGLRINFDGDLTEYSHTGYLPGYMSMTLYYPQFDMSLVMLENISLNLNSLERVFELHNQVRAIIRERLLSTQIQDVK